MSTKVKPPVNNSTSIKIVLALLLLIPAAVNFWLPIYNMVNPELGGLPFFWWFQILLLAVSTVPYLAFSYIEGKRHPEYTVNP